MATYRIIEGTTAALRFQLLEAGAPIDLSGSNVVLLLADRLGNVIASPGTVTVTDAINGKVQLVPTNASTFSAGLSPYSARWKITDSGGSIYYVPTGPRDIWDVTGA